MSVPRLNSNLIWRDICVYGTAEASKASTGRPPHAQRLIRLFQNGQQRCRLPLMQKSTQFPSPCRSRRRRRHLGLPTDSTRCSQDSGPTALSCTLSRHCHWGRGSGCAVAGDGGRQSPCQNATGCCRPGDAQTSCRSLQMMHASQNGWRLHTSSLPDGSRCGGSSRC